LYAAEKGKKIVTREIREKKKLVLMTYTGLMVLRERNRYNFLLLGNGDTVPGM